MEPEPLIPGIGEKEFMSENSNSGSHSQWMSIDNDTLFGGFVKY